MICHLRAASNTWVSIAAEHRCNARAARGSIKESICTAGVPSRGGPADVMVLAGLPIVSNSTSAPTVAERQSMPEQAQNRCPAAVVESQMELAIMTDEAWCTFSFITQRQHQRSGIARKLRLLVGRLCCVQPRHWLRWPSPFCGPGK